MSEEPTPWATPRRPEAEPLPPWATPRPAGDENPVLRRVRNRAPDPAPSVSRPPRTPPPGPAPPHPAAQAPKAAAPSDPHVGLIAGPLRVTLAPESARRSPGLVAVVVTAPVTLAAAAGRLLTAGPRPALIVLGVLMPLAFVTIVGLTRRRGAEVIYRFTLRSTTAQSRPYTLRGVLPVDALETGDLVRVVPGRRDARLVEVLATLHGPVVRRLAGRPAVPPAQWIGLAMAAVLLATTVGVMVGQIP